LINTRTKHSLIDTFQKLKKINQYILEQKAKYLRCQKKKYLNGVDIDSKYLEQVTPYKYLGSIANGDNSIEEEIKESIALDSKAYYAN